MNNPQYSMAPGVSTGYPGMQAARPMYYVPAMSQDQPPPSQPFPDDDDTDSDDEGGNKKAKGKGGSSCHQCKSRRNFNALTYCTSLQKAQGRSRSCKKKFCSHCLRKFYKEQAASPAEKQNWTCPSCRFICCCAACRRRKDKDSSSPAIGPQQATKKRKKRVDEGSSSDDDDYHHTHQHTRPTPAQYQQQRAHMPQGALPTHQAMYQYRMHSVQQQQAMHHPHPHPQAVAVPVNVQPAAKPEPRLLWSDGGRDGLDIGALAAKHPLMLQESVRRRATTAAIDPSNAFARLYQVAHQPHVKQRLSSVLARADIDKATKVELIADVLRSCAPPPGQAYSLQSRQTMEPPRMTVERSVGRIPRASDHDDHSGRPGGRPRSNSGSGSGSGSHSVHAPTPLQALQTLQMRPVPDSPISYLYGLSPPVFALPDAQHPPMQLLPTIGSSAGAGTGATAPATVTDVLSGLPQSILTALTPSATQPAGQTSSTPAVLGTRASVPSVAATSSPLLSSKQIYDFSRNSAAALNLHLDGSPRMTALEAALPLPQGYPLGLGFSSGVVPDSGALTSRNQNQLLLMPGNGVIPSSGVLGHRLPLGGNMETIELGQSLAHALKNDDKVEAPSKDPKSTKDAVDSLISPKEEND